MSDVLDVASVRADRDPRTTLEALAWLGNAIDADAAADGFAAWGASCVVDEFLHEPVLSAGLFHALHDRAGLKGRWPVGNAGLLHVYGYLLSPVMTPFGLKRDRWITGTLAALCGLAPDAFVPWASTRTLLDRVTEAATTVLDEHLCRTEHVGDAVAQIALTASTGPAALAYALHTPLAGRRIVTMFPVSDAAALLADIDENPPRLRWNAALLGDDLSAN